MPGLCVLVSSRPDPPLVRRLEEATGSISRYRWHQVSTWTNGATAGLAIVALEHMAEHGLFHDVSDRVAVVLDGEIYAADAERGRLSQSGVRFIGTSHAELLLRGLRAEGSTFLQRLHGTFSAVIWDEADGTLAVVTDRFGMRPAYSAPLPGGFAVASEIKVLRSLPGVDTSWDQDGVAEFFAFGHLFGDSTLHAGIRALPASLLGVYRSTDESYHEEVYFTSRPGTQFRRADDGIDALDHALTAAVARRAHPGERLGLSLSGGLDARTILGFMPTGCDVKTVSLGIEGSLDHRSSTALAALAGVPHTNYVLDAAFLSRFETHLAEMVHLTDGHYLDQGIVMTTLPLYRTLGIDFLLRGHGGELLHMQKAYAFSLDREALAAGDDAAIERWLFGHLTAYMLAGVPDDLFNFDVRGRARQALRTALARTTPGTRPVERIWQLFVNERLHRETALSMHMFNSFATVRMPFIDNDVVDVVLSLPVDLRLDEALQAALLGRRRPDFLPVVNANTGAPVGASRLRRKLASLKMRVAAKLGVKGYQPYERLGLWLRRELRPLVEGTLLSPTFMELGWCRPEGIERIIQQHDTGQANHTFLLMALLVAGLGRTEPGAVAERRAAP